MESRLTSLFASLFFSVPTAALIWLGVNKELAFWGGFLSSHYLLGSILIFAAIAFVLPRLFPSILGAVWRGVLRIERWWGW
ncbi:hypothetical protein [Tamilnaduibacter salinus]|nr:hypothetical protein [Tamilnaduibacter salinus]